MPFQHLLIIYLIGTLLVVLPSFGFARLFEKAGVPSWKAYVPFYNTWIMQELGQRPKHWVFWQLIPVAGWFITLGIFVEFVKLFGKFSFGAHTLASLLAPVYFTYLGVNKDTRFTGPDKVKEHKKAAWREWVDAAVFAVVAATLIRLFVFEAYTIPTPSMEKSLLVNDFLFVSKLSYGPRVPNTPLSVPFVHNYLPGSKAKSYVEWIKLPYIRWFAAPVKRGDAVVFNFPDGDTVVNHENFQSGLPYYQLKRWLNAKETDKVSLDKKAYAQMILSDPDNYPLAVHPVDKTDNYIKRCIGVAGDSVQIRDGIVYVNGQRQQMAPDAQMRYLVRIKGNVYLDPDVMREEYNLDDKKNDYSRVGGMYPNEYRMVLTERGKEKMEKAGLIESITLDPEERFEQTFPYDSLHHYDRDNFGPIWIPKKGATLTLTAENFALYERAIRQYEHNELRREGDRFFINEQPTNQYTFKMDYYWMMGDNRMSSQDSRYWGFVPEDHIVGKAWIIWFSYEKGGGIRWSRLFKLVK